MPIFLKIIVSVFLLIGIINPRITWMISEGWKFLTYTQVAPC
ncbi:hypothetical protein SBF1_8000001 [Candidatus Desulfosporosinus infrequens]|uniref:Uncharacterized protein n=1 Tax=Candidatus Desulfosporosinus infrequens TaxID=2043169 RepID=A0A2U3LTL6_9FIRM|nr:hypothetical protein SBF1_8000001 [Candidatus Desulfosporosinus infrequens]